LNKSEKSLNFKAEIFKALGDPIRLEILLFLKDGERCVCEIVPYLKLTQPSTSRHLKILYDAGLLKFRRDRNKNIYSLVDERILHPAQALDIDLLQVFENQIVSRIKGGE